MSWLLIGAYWGFGLWLAEKYEEDSGVKRSNLWHTGFMLVWPALVLTGAPRP